jgi:hypothetical protein
MCFSPGKARGSTGWQNCQVLVILTKACAFYQLPLKACALNGPGYPPAFKKARTL